MVNHRTVKMKKNLILLKKSLMKVLVKLNIGLRQKK